MAAPFVEPKIYTAIGLDFETGGLDCTRCACTQVAVQALRLDTLKVFDRYSADIAPYHKQELGAAKRRVLKTKHELSQPSERMDYERVALDYSGITMDTLINQGADMKEVAAGIIRFARKSALSKGAQCKPILIGQTVFYEEGVMKYFATQPAWKAAVAADTPTATGSSVVEPSVDEPTFEGSVNQPFFESFLLNQ